MEKIDYKSLAARLFCLGFLGALGVFFFKYLFGYILPFLIAWGVAYLIYPVAEKLSAKIKISRRACSFLLVLLLLILILALIFLLFNRLFYEIQNLLDYLTANGDLIAGYFESIFDFVFSIGEKLPIINKLKDTQLTQAIIENVNSFISGVWQGLIDALSSAVPDFAADVVGALPSVVLVSLVTVVACFYFAMDIDTLNERISSILPEGVRGYIKRLKGKLKYGIKRYFKAYLILFLITFSELFVGFLILGIDYSFVLAILIAFVDFLPVFGTPAVLLPWAIVAFLMKNYFLGVGLSIMLVIITVVRQALEPRILGKNLGVHPIVTLVTLYLGFELFGLWGMIFLPILVLVLFSKGGEDDKLK